MGHSYNHGIVTTSKGITLDAIRVNALNTTPVILEDCKSGLVSGVSRTSAGIYVFQMTVPYLPKFVIISPEISSANGTATTLTARYQTNSYNAATGQFIINVSGGANPTTPALTDPAATDELHVLMLFRRYTT